MTQTLTPADVPHYYQRLAELSTLPFWQVPDITDPAGPERGHVWHWHDIHPELARSREIADEAAALQRRAPVLRPPRRGSAAHAGHGRHRRQPGSPRTGR